MVNADIIKDFFAFLNNNNIKYVLIKNDDNIIPNYVESNNDIDFLIHPDDYNKLIKESVEYGYVIVVGESCKRYFLEQLRNDILIKKDDCYFHFFEALSCNPLTNMGECKLPLDRKIQKYIWNNRVWDEKNNWWIMDDVSILLYLIIRSIFDKKEFKNKYIREIIKRKKLIETKEFICLANMVFWGFTPCLIDLVKHEEFTLIFNKYLSYSKY